MSAPVVHLISGSLGAGKTTYAIGLARRLPGVRFSIDEWMMTLFAPDRPQPLDLAWIWDRVDRCERKIGALALQVASLGTAVILDLGFTQLAQRRTMAERFRAAGLDVQLHWLAVDPAERWRRVSARNLARGETYALTVTRQMFDFMEARYEPPTPEELKDLNGFKVEPAETRQ